MDLRSVGKIALLISCVYPLSSSGQTPESIGGFLNGFERVKQATESRLQALQSEFMKEYDPDKTGAEQRGLVDALETETQEILESSTREALELIRTDCADKAAAAPLAWVASTSKNSAQGREAIALLMEHHLVHQETLQLGKSLGRSGFPIAEKILRAQSKSNELPAEQAWEVKLALARLLLATTDLIERCTFLDEVELDKLKERLGKETAARMTEGNLDVYADEAIGLFQQLRREHPNEEVTRGLSLSDFSSSCIFYLQHLRVGMPVPDIEGETLDGTTLKLSDFRGKVVLLSFWGTWCGPCMGLMPEKVAIAQKYSDRPFAIVGVNSDSNRDAVKPALAENGITWPSFWCGKEGPLGPIPRAWNITRWPTNFLIDEHGMIRGKNLQKASLELAIAELVERVEESTD